MTCTPFQLTDGARGIACSRGHARLSLHVWHLVAKALTAMGYGQ